MKRWRRLFGKNSRLVLHSETVQQRAMLSAMRNIRFRSRRFKRRSYIELADKNPRIPWWVYTIAQLLKNGASIARSIKVDVWLHGCPPTADQIWFAVSGITAGPKFPYCRRHIYGMDSRGLNKGTQSVPLYKQNRNNWNEKYYVKNNNQIAPVTRIEGHAKITIQLDENDDVLDARFHVNEFRGFEKFTEGRLLWEMPGITSRICGICPRVISLRRQKPVTIFSQ